ncbi:MAG: hypothetical protein KF773_37770 [Deltaproteobacteria bacterium]|nr:hypothetical protein [Deltaproteobacteria bacterium]MCW5802355.1 hypothetical protein [Deltaproteobacteria bacterium]
MNVDPLIAQKTRNEIIGLLSDEELRTVSTAEEERIPEGDEYIDLEHPELGVRQAEANTPGAHALPRTAVSDATWSRILTTLATPAG